MLRKTIIIFVLWLLNLGAFALSINKVTSAESNNYIIADFLGGWVHKPPESIPFGYANRIYIAFGNFIVLGDGSLGVDWEFKHAYARELLRYIKATKPNVQLFLSLIGDAYFAKAANDPKFAANVVNFLKQYKLNGLDLDWEHSIDRQALNLLLGNLHNSFESQGLYLTLDIMPYTDPLYVVNHYDIATINKYVDQVNLMTYGLDYGVSDVSALVGQLNKYGRGIAPAKMIVGIETETNYVHGYDTFGESGSIAKKSRYAVCSHFAGMMEWHLTNDHVNDPNNPEFSGARELYNWVNYWAGGQCV